MALLIEGTTTQTESQQIKSNVGFWWEGKTGVPGEKPLRTEWGTNKLNSHMAASQEIEPGPCWWKVSALTTAPTLLLHLWNVCQNWRLENVMIPFCWLNRLALDNIVWSRTERKSPFPMSLTSSSSARERNKHTYFCHLRTTITS